MENKISACLVVYNEEKNIKRCLDSIKDVVYEIIVVHDGKCRDRTLEICEEYGAKIFIRRHAGYMEAHIPFCFKQASESWLLRIDADEYLSDNLKKNLRRLVEDKNIDAYKFLWPLWGGKKYITRSWPYKLCLFRKDKVSFLGILHFIPEIKGSIKIRSDLILEHRPSRNNYTFRVFQARWMKWAKIQADTYLKKLKEIPKFNYEEDSWSQKIKLRIKFTTILMPFDFLLSFLRTLLDGAYREGLTGLKVALLNGAYKLVVDYYIYKNKNLSNFDKN